MLLPPQRKSRDQYRARKGDEENYDLNTNEMNFHKINCIDKMQALKIISAIIFIIEI